MKELYLQPLATAVIDEDGVLSVKLDWDQAALYADNSHLTDDEQDALSEQLDKWLVANGVEGGVHELFPEGE